MKNKQITIVDVAKAAGVSIATVSNVLNRRNVPLTAETIRKVEEAAAYLGYRRNVMAANLSRKKTYELGLIIPGFGGYYGDFAQEMQRIVHQWGYHLSVYASSNNPELEQRHLETLLQRRVDGLFCHGLAMSPDLTRTIVGEGTPLVLFNAWGWPEAMALGAVNLDFAGGSAQMVRHLAEQGCRTLYYSGKSRARATDEQRRIGFLQGIESLRGTNSYPDYIELMDGDQLDDEALIDAMTERLEDGPAGVLAFDDFIAFILISRLKERGYDVPGQIKVAGINDQPLALHNSPSITSLSIDYDAQARQAVQLLMEELGDEKWLSSVGPSSPEGEPMRRGNEINIPMQLIKRKSTSHP
jgi:LacI family transcriptional regulator